MASVEEKDTITNDQKEQILFSHLTKKLFMIPKMWKYSVNWWDKSFGKFAEYLPWECLAIHLCP